MGANEWAQVISVVAGILAIVMMQFKNVKIMLFFQVLVNLTAASTYLLVGGDSGMIVSILATIQAIVMFLYQRKNKIPHLAVTIIFVAAYFGLAIYSTLVKEDFMEMLPAICAFCYSMALVQKKPSAFRVWGALNPTFWIPYDLYTGAIVMSLVHTGILVSSVVGMIRLDGFLKSKKKK